MQNFLKNGKKSFGKSVEIYNTNKIIKKYRKMVKKCERGSLGRF